MLNSRENTSPLLASFDGLNWVIHIGSFSKVLTASARCSYIAVRRAYSMLRQGTYRHHIDALRNQLADAMGRTLHRLEKLGISPWMKP